MHTINLLLFSFVLKLIICNPNIWTSVSQSWKRNLIAEGIEPNPGPSWTQFEKALEEFIGEDEDAKTHFIRVLPSLKNIVQKLCSIEYVDTTAILQVIENKENESVLLKAGIDDSCRRAIDEVIQSIQSSKLHFLLLITVSILYYFEVNFSESKSKLKKEGKMEKSHSDIEGKQSSRWCGNH